MAARPRLCTAPLFGEITVFGLLSCIAVLAKQTMLSLTILCNASMTSENSSDTEAVLIKLLDVSGCLTAALNYYRAYLRYEPPIYEDYQIKAPTLFMWGVKDTALSRESAEASFRFIPDIKIHWFESAGHLVSQEDPDQVNKLMADFLS